MYEGRALIGGSGYDMHIKLPPEIDKVKPHINWGFTTRGCIRKCPWCFVPKMEGGIKIIGDLYDIWDGKSKKIYIMDNNILAVPDHFSVICQQVSDNDLICDFNQGLDHRLLTVDIWKELKQIKKRNQKHGDTVKIRFALDDIHFMSSATKALDIMSSNGLSASDTRWYIYVSPSDTFYTVYERLELIRKYRQIAYVMRDKSIYNVPLFIALASWGTHPKNFAIPLKDAIATQPNLHKYVKYFPVEFGGGTNFKNNSDAVEQLGLWV
jgi:hypothetical protein